jgi:hypothetical protein
MSTFRNIKLVQEGGFLNKMRRFIKEELHRAERTVSYMYIVKVCHNILSRPTYSTCTARNINMVRFYL